MSTMVIYSDRFLWYHWRDMNYRFVETDFWRLGVLYLDLCSRTGHSRPSRFLPSLTSSLQVLSRYPLPHNRSTLQWTFFDRLIGRTTWRPYTSTQTPSLDTRKHYCRLAKQSEWGSFNYSKRSAYRNLKEDTRTTSSADAWLDFLDLEHSSKMWSLFAPLGKPSRFSSIQYNYWKYATHRQLLRQTGQKSDNRPWTEEDDRKLSSLVQQGFKLTHIAKEMTTHSFNTIEWHLVSLKVVSSISFSVPRSSLCRRRKRRLHMSIFETQKSYS